MAKLSRQWLIDTMVIDEITGFKLENIHFCSTRSGPRGKGVIARKLGITHMVDDHDEALKDVYLAQSENGAAFPVCGQLFHFASSGVGHPPSRKHWKQEERPDCVIPVGSWKEVMERLRILTKSTQYNTEHPDPPQENDSSLWDSWCEVLNYEAPASDLTTPAMPLISETTYPQAHRARSAPQCFPFPAAVTRMISRKEANQIPEALEAMRKEYQRLSGKCWIEGNRRSKQDVIRDARARGVEVHFSMVHGIIGEKGYELPQGDPRNKFKGRAVLLGDRVFNQDYETATFADLGSAPTTLEGGRMVDAYGCARGNESQASDAIQAFCQAPMLSKVWVTLHREAVFDPEHYYAVRDCMATQIVLPTGKCIVTRKS